MSTVSATVSLRDNDLEYRRIRAVVRPELSPMLYLSDDSLVMVSGHGAERPVEIADAVLAAVTEWHAEIHRRGHADPVTEPAAQPPLHQASREESP